MGAGGVNIGVNVLCLCYTIQRVNIFFIQIIINVRNPDMFDVRLIIEAGYGLKYNL